MPGIARQFEPQITRSGGTPSKFRFTIRCSECAKTDAYESNRSVSHDFVKRYFDERGWLLGRDRSYDICPVCLARSHGSSEARPSGQSQRMAAAPDKRHRDTADILARHLGKPEALAAEVFRPKETPPRVSAPQAPSPSTPVPDLPPAMERVLADMAADLKGLRSTMELVAEQVAQLAALSSSQVDAIARFAPALIKSAESLSGSLRHVAGAVQTVPHGSAPDLERQSTLEAGTAVESARADDARPTQAVESEEPSPPKRRTGVRRARVEADQVGAHAVVVRSIADAKRADRFYTSIRLPRELWDQAGFGPDDRLMLEWSGKALIIERTRDGGVKPKAVGNTSVVLQSWKLGNLNFDQPKVTGADGSLRIVVGRKPPVA
ncbi:hypothetical protein [Microvirga sp. TS319]|uniref:hypothetical protein n=1 Tax=Microvirga sp. TS319 TaxID=3241165 RepID=UPI00351AA2F4